MRRTILFFLMISLIGCSPKKEKDTQSINQTRNMKTKQLIQGIPTIGVLIFDGFLTNEVIAPIDVFAKPDKEGTPLFNVVTLAKEQRAYKSEEGLVVFPDFKLEETPNLNVLVIPSSYHPDVQEKDTTLITFIQEQNQTTGYIASHCAGAFLVGASGIADQKEIVTYVTGGEMLQKAYPQLQVLDDRTISVARDGKFFSSNGGLVSYTSSLDLLEKMTSVVHRKYVEEVLLLDRL